MHSITTIAVALSVFAATCHAAPGRPRFSGLGLSSGTGGFGGSYSIANDGEKGLFSEHTRSDFTAQLTYGTEEDYQWFYATFTPLLAPDKTFENNIKCIKERLFHKEDQTSRVALNAMGKAFCADLPTERPDNNAFLSTGPDGHKKPKKLKFYIVADSRLAQWPSLATCTEQFTKIFDNCGDTGDSSERYAGTAISGGTIEGDKVIYVLGVNDQYIKE